MKKYELKKYINEDEYTCVLIKDEELIMRSFDKGVAPLYKFIIENEKLPTGNIQMGDKIVGRAVAFLAIFIGVSYIYTKLISETALDVLKDYDIKVEYDEVVPYISNRKKDGQCPMEKALANVNTKEMAFEIIDEFMKRRK